MMALPPPWLALRSAAHSEGVTIDAATASKIVSRMRAEGWEIVADWQVDLSKVHIGLLLDSEG